MSKAVVYLALVFLGAKTWVAAEEHADECAYGGDLCQVDAQKCLNYYHEDDPVNCYDLQTTQLYIGSDDAAFTAGPRIDSTSVYVGGAFTVTIKSKGTWKHVEGCCNTEFGKNCTIKSEDMKGGLNVHAVLRRGDGTKYCYHIISAIPKEEVTEWCCSNFKPSVTNVSCRNRLPCMGMVNGNLVMKTQIFRVSWGSQAKNDYCFFKAPNSYAKRGIDLPNTTLVLQVPDISMSTSGKNVTLGGKTQRCNLQKAVHIDPSRYVAGWQWESGSTWCFFVRAEAFRRWDETPTCLQPCVECINRPFEITRAVVITLVAVLLIVLAVVFWLYRKKMASLFPNKKECTNDIPPCTKEVFAEDDLEVRQILIEREKADLVIVCEDTRNVDYANEEGVLKLLTDGKFEDMNEKPRSVRGHVESPKKIEAKGRERIDSGLEEDEFPNDTTDGEPMIEGYSLKINSGDDLLDHLSTGRNIQGTNMDSGSFSINGCTSSGFAENNSSIGHSCSGFCSSVAHFTNSSIDEAKASSLQTDFGSSQMENDDKAANELPYLDKRDLLPVVRRQQSYIEQLQTTENNNNGRGKESPAFRDETVGPSEERCLDSLTFDNAGQGQHVLDFLGLCNGKFNNKRISESSTDTGCGTNSCDDEQHFHRKWSASDNHSDSLPGYVAKWGDGFDDFSACTMPSDDDQIEINYIVDGYVAKC